MRIYILALDGVFDIGLSSLIDVISTANELGSQLASSDAANPQLDMRLVGCAKEYAPRRG